MKVKYLLIIIAVLTTNSSCKLIKSIKELKRDKAVVKSYTFDGKEINYIPMHHLGKQKFYDDVKQKIKQYKQQGYRVYYEEISSKIDLDSLQKDTIRRKVRKIKGFNGTYEDVAKGTSFEKYIKQPSYKDLGIEINDLRADVNYLQFIQEWEKVNGIIILDSTDLNTNFQTKYDKGAFYTTSQYNKIVIEFRNQNLVNLIKSNDDKKILILYGLGHLRDFEKRIAN